MNIPGKAKEMQEQLVAWRRALHEIPEIGNELPQTSQFVQDRLAEMGIPFVTMVNGSGIVATIEGGKPGKTVALRADMDALPIPEETELPFKSTNGNMHACGHDSHAAMLLGAAKILWENRGERSGNVKLIFQPGEENPGGAKPMIEEGCLAGVDAIFGQHIGNLGNIEQPSGEITISRGTVMACRDAFKIVIRGSGAHSSTPELSIDPVAVAAQVVNGIYMIKAREISALSPAVISVCMIHGGTASNVIPDTVELEGSTRSIDPAARALIARRIEEVVQHICTAFGATYEYNYLWDYGITINNPDMADLVIKSAGDLGMGDSVVMQEKPLMGSEDMSFYLERVPGAYYFLSSVVKQDGRLYGHHNARFMLDESVFWQGTAMFVQIAENYLKG